MFVSCLAKEVGLHPVINGKPLIGMKQGDGIFIFMLRQNHFNGQIWGVDEGEKAWSQEAIAMHVMLRVYI